MATYTPIALIEAKAMGNGSGAIATWQKQTTAAHTYIARTIWINTPTAARTVTIEEGATATATTAQRIVDAYPLTANVPFITNSQLTIPASSYLQGYANAADINGQASGYDYA